MNDEGDANVRFLGSREFDGEIVAFGMKPVDRKGRYQSSQQHY